MTPSIPSSNHSPIFFVTQNNDLPPNPNSSELSNEILSTIELIKKTAMQDNNVDLPNKNFCTISALLKKEIDSDTIGNLSNEISQLNDLYRLITKDFGDVFTNEVIDRNQLGSWILTLKWLLRAFKDYQYIKIDMGKKDPRYNYYRPKAEIILRKPPLNLSREEFFGLITPLIQDCYLPSYSLFVTIPGINEDFFTYFSDTILRLDQKGASPQEFYTEVLCFFGDKQKMTTQAILRNTLNYGDNVPFPKSIHFHADDVYIWEAFKCTPSLKNYYQLGFNELYFSLKMFDQYYQGNPKSLIEYQNIVEDLGFNQPGIKEFKFREELPLVLFKKQMNELLTVFKKKNQLFRFESHTFSRKALQLLISSDSKPYLPCYFTPYRAFQCKFLNNDHLYYISADKFFEIFYYSLIFSKETSIDQLIEKQSCDNFCYKINCSSSVFQAVYNLDNYKFESMTPAEICDLSFLFARASIECEELDEKIKKITFGVDEWKAKFIQWNVNFNNTGKE